MTTYLETPDFKKGLQKLQRAGDASRLAANKWRVAYEGCLEGQKLADHLHPTHHGETRMENAVKYQLSGFHRLLTWQKKGVVLFVYIGTHDDMEKFLTTHAGTDFLAKGRQITSVQVSRGKRTFTKLPDDSVGSILGRLPNRDKELDTLLISLSRKQSSDIFALQVGCTEKDILNAIASIKEDKDKVCMRDVLTHLNAGDVTSADNVIAYHFGELKDITGGIKGFEGNEDAQILPQNQADLQRYINDLQRTGSYHQWFFFMGPAQQQLVIENFAGPAVLSGVSGSGKTCVAIKRAIRLAEENPGKKVGLLTLNRSLSSFIKNLVKEVCSNSISENINVASFFEVCQEQLCKFDPDNEQKYNDETIVLNEHVDEIYREFYRCYLNNYDAICLKPIHNLLISNSIDAETYLRDEFDWIRSGFVITERDKYLQVQRTGRFYPIRNELRQSILNGLSAWETKMDAVGVSDYLALTNALTGYLHKLSPVYDFCIVDEAQDFGTTELQIIRGLTRTGENDIFLCGDVTQHILAKQQNIKDAGIMIDGRSRLLDQNYRNSREILRCAYNFIIDHLNEEMFTREMDIQDPKEANFTGPSPLVLKADSFKEELEFAISFLEEEIEEQKQNGQSERSYSGCIVLCGFSLLQISNFAQKYGYSVLDGKQSFNKSEIIFSDIEQTKGYEFDTVVILNCAENVIPPQWMPEVEQWRIASQLYVAMTRARNKLYFSFNDVLSDWIVSCGLESVPWKDLIESTNTLEEIPKSIDEIAIKKELTTDNAPSLGEIDVEQFLYTSYAIGLSTTNQDHLRRVVDGRGLKRGGRRIKWANMISLYKDMRKTRKSGRAGYFMGPEADDEIFSHLDAAFRDFVQL